MLVEEAYYLDENYIVVKRFLAKKLNAYITINCQDICFVRVKFPEKIERFEYYYSTFVLKKDKMLRMLLDRVDEGVEGYPMNYKFFVNQNDIVDSILYIFYIDQKRLKKSKKVFGRGGFLNTDMKIYRINLGEYYGKGAIQKVYN